MNEKNIFEGNRAAWNQASVYHQKALKRSLHKNFEDPKFSTLKKSRDYVVNEKLKQIDFHGKTIAHMPCNNGRELLSLMRLGAKEDVYKRQRLYKRFSAIHKQRELTAGCLKRREIPTIPFRLKAQYIPIEFNLSLIHI